MCMRSGVLYRFAPINCHDDSEFFVVEEAGKNNVDLFVDLCQHTSSVTAASKTLSSPTRKIKSLIKTTLPAYQRN